MHETTSRRERAIAAETTNKKERAMGEETIKAVERANGQETTIQHERAKVRETTRQCERVRDIETTTVDERARDAETTNLRERANNNEEERQMTEREQDKQVVRMLVRAREDFQGMRKRMDNRIGRKADGTAQNIEERTMQPTDVQMFGEIANAARAQEKQIEKELRKVLKRFPVYTQYLTHVKGVGEIAAGWIVGEYDIHRATTVSKLCQFTGLNSGMVQGKKRIENKDGSFSLVPTDTLVRGDRLTPGYVAPFNKRLRTAMVGVLADGFIKALIRYRDASEDEYNETQETYRRTKNGKYQVVDTAEGYGRLYLETKQRLSVSEKICEATGKMWKEESKGHRDRYAKRKMIKMFLRDLYVAWRTIEGLPVRPSYQEEYLGHVHSAEDNHQVAASGD